MAGIAGQLVRRPALSAVCLTALAGCAGGPRAEQRALLAFDAARYGEAREILESTLTDDRSSRSYILDRERLLIASLADGQPSAAELVANDTFSILRVQGLNADRTTASVVINEGVKIWKGEPFEQALAYSYISIQKAMIGEWDNARAAANASLFLLRDFGENERGEKLNTLEIAQHAQKEGDQYLDKGYAAVKTDFALGYLLSGLSSKAIGRDDEASDFFNEAARVNAGLAPLCQQLASGPYNTVLVVDAGRGPSKMAYGPDNALARFEPRTMTDARGLSVEVIDGESVREVEVVAQACDVNTMAQSHMWNNLEDVRVAKSVLGDVLLKGGLIVAATSGERDRNGRRGTNEAQLWAGLGAAVLGAFLKAGAHADTRHLEFLPQRVYVVPLQIDSPDSTYAVQVVGEPTTRLILPALDPPRNSGLQLRYVRLDSQLAGGASVLYANDQFAGRVAGDDLPYILGGRCVQHPSEAALRRYQGAGHLTNMTVVELENLYREEGITLTVEDQRGQSRRHVLEGGDSLVEPLAGTAGYARIFCREHGAYRPRSQAVQELASSLAKERAPSTNK